MTNIGIEEEGMERIRVGQEEIVIRAASEELLAVEVEMPPGGGPPMMHRHAAAEVYRVERGELTIYLDGRRIPAPAGAVVPIPGGAEHTIRNESDSDALAYVVFTPGAEMERFMRAAAELTDPAIEEVLALATRHGVEMTGPIPVA
jgi:mannose-6-phosphate isomerase-like protein (cupin superfamily)